MQIGVALPMACNVPFKVVDERRAAPGIREGSGDLPLGLTGGDRIAYLALWPHVRPWRIARPEPMLRCIPDAGRGRRILGRSARPRLRRRREQRPSEASCGARTTRGGRRIVAGRRGRGMTEHACRPDPAQAGADRRGAARSALDAADAGSPARRASACPRCREHAESTTRQLRFGPIARRRRHGDSTTDRGRWARSPAERLPARHACAASRASAAARASARRRPSS